MQLLAGSWFWCPRCGTTATAIAPGHRLESMDERTVAVPTGVEYVRLWLRLRNWALSVHDARMHMTQALLHPTERGE